VTPASVAEQKEQKVKNVATKLENEFALTLTFSHPRGEGTTFGCAV